jgi:3-oxoacyl-ACP reductase-like protein
LLILRQGILASKFGFGEQRSNGVLLHGVAMQPSKRFGNEGEAVAWLSEVAASYASHNGVTLGAVRTSCKKYY